MAEDTVSLLELARQNNVTPGPSCRFAAILSNHERRDEIRELLAACGKEIRYSTAQEVLKTAGIEVSPDTISRHCRGMCSCRS